MFLKLGKGANTKEVNDCNRRNERDYGPGRVENCGDERIRSGEPQPTIMESDSHAIPV